MRQLTLDTDTLKAIKANSVEGEDLYSKLLASKQEWVPAAGNTEGVRNTSGIEETLKKCVALALALELPVGHLISNAIDLSGLEIKKFTDSQAALLADNALDELVHFKAFEPYQEWAKYYHEEANQITSEFLSIPNANPVFVAGYVELGLFFIVLGLMRKYGNSALQLMSGYVSRDEAAHVRTNWALIDDMKLGHETPKLASLRKDVVAWLTSSLTVLGSKQEYWLNQSDKLINTRKSDMVFTKAAQYTAFFEVPNTSLGYY